jgi:hypothetical protein
MPLEPGNQNSEAALPDLFPEQEALYCPLLAIWRNAW